VLTSTTSAQRVERLLNRLTDRIRQPVIFRDTTVSVTASFGCALLQPQAEPRGKAELPSVSQLLRCADQAMYDAKHSGRDSWRIVTTPCVASSGEIGLPSPQNAVLGRKKEGEQKQPRLHQHDATGR
jgi:predicted signal transduction protein with EAL and GGDEF domain